MLGRQAMQKFGAIVSTIHGLVKFPTRSGISTIKGNIKLLEEGAQRVDTQSTTQNIAITIEQASQMERLCGNKRQIPRAKSGHRKATTNSLQTKANKPYAKK